MYRAKQAEGSGRTDWVVMGPCSCADRDETNCLRCEGYAVIVRFSGLTESEAHDLTRRLNSGKDVEPFNPPRFENK